MHQLYWRSLIAAACLSASACSGGFSMVAPQPPPNYQVLGHASGSACGSLLLGPTMYNVIPLGLGGRAERAYQNAVASVPAATGLIDVTLQENWSWWILGSSRCVTIEGEAIK